MDPVLAGSEPDPLSTPQQIVNETHFMAFPICDQNLPVG